jgi:DNA polymerase elongation subunit (family B)
MNKEELLGPDAIKKFAWHLKTMGAYVQEPVPSIVGLDENTVIASNDAAALYPTTGIYQNLGYDTLRDRIYDAAIVKKMIGLLEHVFKTRDTDPSAIDSAIFGFKNALSQVMLDYFKRKSVQNKKDAKDFTLEYYPLLLSRLLKYPGKLTDIFTPKTDQQYYLLQSCLYPLLETITWLSPQNKGYNQTVVDYVFFNDIFDNKYKTFYIMREINSTKTNFQVLNLNEIKEVFKTRILNPYGTLYNLHRDKLSYDVEILQDSLNQRRVVKNQMLVLYAVLEHYEKLPEKIKEYFYSPENGDRLSDRQAYEILDAIQDAENRDKRVQALTGVELNFEELAEAFLSLRADQLKILQLGIKVSMNSSYGIFAMITWLYASPLIGNSFTSAGKIYGIKLFQAVSVNILEKLGAKNGTGP